MTGSRRVGTIPHMGQDMRPLDALLAGPRLRTDPALLVTVRALEGSREQADENHRAREHE